MSCVLTKQNILWTSLKRSAGLRRSNQRARLRGIVENHHGENISKAELLTPNSRRERSIGVQCREGARKCSFTVGLPIVIRSGKVWVVAHSANYYRDLYSNGQVTQVCRHCGRLRNTARLSTVLCGYWELEALLEIC